MQPGLPTLSSQLLPIAVALGIGLLVGVERERSKGTGARRAAGGIRTFALLSLAGALSELIGGGGLLVAGVLVCLLIVASYLRSPSDDPGLTTEVAMLVTFLLGVLALRDAAMGAGLGIVLVILLAGKSRLHRFASHILTADELHDLLLLMAAAFVVLPLLPDTVVDPWGALNPRRLWTLVIAVMVVSTVGYTALRAFGSRLGLPLAGLAGGFVSSTATVAAMAARARGDSPRSAAFACAALLSNVATLIQLAVVLGAMAPALLARLQWSLGLSGTAAIAAALLSSLGAFKGRTSPGSMLAKRPFELRHVLGFVAILAAISLAVAIARQLFGDASLAWTLGMSGLADVHAAAAAAAQMVTQGTIETQAGAIAVLAALAANSLVKCLLAARGGSAFAWRVIPGVALMVAVFAATAQWAVYSAKLLP